MVILKELQKEYESLHTARQYQEKAYKLRDDSLERILVKADPELLAQYKLGLNSVTVANKEVKDAEKTFRESVTKWVQNWCQKNNQKWSEVGVPFAKLSKHMHLKITDLRGVVDWLLMIGMHNLVQVDWDTTAGRNFLESLLDHNPLFQGGHIYWDGESVRGPNERKDAHEIGVISRGFDVKINSDWSEYERASSPDADVDSTDAAEA